MEIICCISSSLWRVPTNTLYYAHSDGVFSFSTMLATYFFVLGLVNSVLLILLFLVRKRRLDLVNRFGWIYFLLAVPAAYGIFLGQQEDQTGQYTIFLAIFLAFLFVEWLFDYALKINFRENWKKNWKWMVPYLGLYYAMNYGFVVMPWKTSLVWGLIMAGLFVVQIVANLRSHPKMGG